MQRQAATPKGLQKRIQDLDLSQVEDPRMAKNVDIALPTLLAALITAMTTQARSLRAVERRTEQIAAKLGSFLGIVTRIADNTFGRVLSRLKVADMTACLHRLIKAEHRRGNLVPHNLPEGAAALDGKNAGTLHWHDLCRVLELDPQKATSEEVKAALVEKYPEAQLCVPEHGKPYALIRMHTVTLISAKAAPCIHIRPILGKTNEIGSVPDLLNELHDSYGHTGLFKVITTDAGNTSLGTAQMTLNKGWDYFAQIKSEHGALFLEAVRELGVRDDPSASATYADQQNGKTATYYAWQYDLGQTGWLDWTHARQLIRIKRVTEHPVTGEITIGNRYYVCNRPLEMLDARLALDFSRAHWRCEDETHWTCDVELGEDRRKLSWSRHPRGILIVAVVRMIALCILAIARKLSRMAYGKETPSWAQVAEHFLLVLCGTTLLTVDFDCA